MIAKVKRRRRQEFRQHSKSTLAQTAEVLWTERQVLRATIARGWRRRVVIAAVVAFAAGAAAGWAASLVI